MALSKVRPATQADIDFVAAHMREADKEELWASGHKTPQFALDLSFEMTPNCVCYAPDGDPVAVLGNPFAIGQVDPGRA